MFKDKLRGLGKILNNIAIVFDKLGNLEILLTLFSTVVLASSMGIRNTVVIIAAVVIFAIFVGIIMYIVGDEEEYEYEEELA